MDNMTNDSWQALITVLYPFLQEQLKKSNLSWLHWVSNATPKINIFLSALVAILTTAGFHFMGNIIDGGTLTIPPLTSLGHVAAQMFGQHAVYQMLIAGPKYRKMIISGLQVVNENVQVVGENAEAIKK